MTGASEAGRELAGRQRRTGRLTEALTAVATAAGERMVSAAGNRMAGATERLVEYAKNSGSPGLAAAATGAKQAAAGKSSGGVALRAGLSGVAAKVRKALGGGGGGKGKVKVTNIVESVDVGVPVRLAYDQWTRFSDWPTFMKKVENVKQDGDEKVAWRAQIFWSHRSWNSTVVEQVPDRRIIWRSDGEKGSVDGCVSFHELAPELTRILLVLEYHPKGLFEKTGNIWRAQGRRARLELKHFARHVMTQSILHPDEVEGWRGEIRDSQVVKDHETAQHETAQDETARDKTARDKERRDRDGGDDDRNERKPSPARRRRADPDDRDERAASPVRRRQADRDDRDEATGPPVRRRRADPDDRRERVATRDRASNRAEGEER